MRWTLPNILTLARICLTPVIALLPFIQGYWPKVIAFLIFLAASASDIVDGYLARRRNEVSELGQLLDPIADKLLLFATLIPIFWLTRHPTILVDYRIPWWGSFPVWVALLLVGRELLMTAFRFFAKRRGVVIPALGAGKLKAVVQNVFIGATLFWFAWKDALATHPFAGWFRTFWAQFHGAAVPPPRPGPTPPPVHSLGVYRYPYRRSSAGSGSCRTPSCCPRSRRASSSWAAGPCPRATARRPRSPKGRRSCRTRGARLRACGSRTSGGDSWSSCPVCRVRCAGSWRSRCCRGSRNGTAPTGRGSCCRARCAPRASRSRRWLSASGGSPGSWGR